MKKTIQKHIDDKNYVQVYLVDDKGNDLTNFSGYIVDFNKDFAVMIDFIDFFYDGIVIFKPEDINEIKHSDNQKFMDTVCVNEGLKEKTYKRFKKLNLPKPKFINYLAQLSNNNRSLIIERLYNGSKAFQLGKVNKLNKKKVYLNYINANGKTDVKPVFSKLNEITFIKIDNPYSSFYAKHAIQNE